MPKFLKHLGQFLKDNWKTFVPLILLGVGASIGAVLLEERFHRAGELPVGAAIGVKVLDHLGLGLIAAGILGIGIELQHMHEYFQKRIQDTMIDRKFIKQLNRTEKEKLQEQALAAFFGVDELSAEEGFYKFYREKIRDHIAGPFRKGTTFKTVVVREGDELFKVTDAISFTCKRGGKSILPKIEWTTERDEITEVLELCIETTKPGQDPMPYRYDGATKTYPPPLQEYKSGHGCDLLLTDYAGCDGLEIALEVTYLVSRERSFSWTMPYLSDGFTGEIHFPDDLRIYVDLFGVSKDAVPKDKLNLPSDKGVTVCKVNHTTWLLPDDGFSFSFGQKPKPPVTPSTAPVISATRESDPVS